MQAVRHADGLQANGFPAFDYYKRFNKNAIAYLDNRAYEADMPTRDHVAAGLAPEEAGDQPLRLAFSGRLEARKGPLEVVAVASELRSRGVDFTFLVAGDGPLRAELEAAVHSAGLSRSL